MFEKPHRPEIVEPQLAAMIDVFSILVIFMIAGTVLGSTSIVLPPGLFPPKSLSHESMVNAPQMTIFESKVRLSFSGRDYPLAAFSADSPDRMQFTRDIQGYLAANKNFADNDILNLVADRALTYDRIFSVIKAVREAGVKSILFISVADAKHD